MLINRIKRKSVRSSRGLLAAVLLLTLQACGGDNLDDLRTFVDNAYKDKKPEIEPLPPIQPFTPYEYSAGGGDDPFSSSNILADNGSGEVEGVEIDRAREPLEAFPLDALKMVGTMSQAGRPWVIVKTSDGTALLASEGNYMGQNQGRITEISPERQLVVLSERVKDTAGRWVTREVQVTVDE